MQVPATQVASFGSFRARIVESRISPVIVLAVFAGFVARTIGFNGPWFDESYTRLLVGPHDFAGILERTAVDSHPPLWYWLLKAWTYAAGDSLVAMRAFSAVCMIAALAVWYAFLRKQFSASVALLGLAIAATSPTIFRYAFEARMYPFGILLMTVSTWLVVMPRTRRTTVAYWLVAVAMLYTHYFLMFVVAAQMLYLLIVRREKGLVAWQVVAFGASILVAFSAWIPVLLSRTEYTMQHGFWIGPFTPNQITGYVLETFLRRMDWDVPGWKAILVMAWFTCFGVAMYRAARQPRTAILWCLVLVPPACLILISIKTPLFYPRYIIFGLLALCALLAIGVLALAGWWRRVVIAIVLAGTCAGFVRELPRNAFRMNIAKKLVDEPIEGELPMVVVVWYFAVLDAKSTLAHPERVVEKRDAPPKFAVNEALYDRSWYILDFAEVKTKHVWTIEDAGNSWNGAPPHWRLVQSYRRGYIRLKLWVQDRDGWLRHVFRRSGEFKRR